MAASVAGVGVVPADGADREPARQAERPDQSRGPRTDDAEDRERAADVAVLQLGAVPATADRGPGGERPISAQLEDAVVGVIDEPDALQAYRDLGGHRAVVRDERRSVASMEDGARRDARGRHRRLGPPGRGRWIGGRGGSVSHGRRRSWVSRAGAANGPACNASRVAGMARSRAGPGPSATRREGPGPAPISADAEFLGGHPRAFDAVGDLLEGDLPRVVGRSVVGLLVDRERRERRSSVDPRRSLGMKSAVRTSMSQISCALSGRGDCVTVMLVVDVTASGGDVLRLVSLQHGDHGHCGRRRRRLRSGTSASAWRR